MPHKTDNPKWRKKQRDIRRSLRERNKLVREKMFGKKGVF